MSDPTFASLGVPQPIVSALAKAGVTAPFPIQAAALPPALEGRDVLGRGPTGSGKTLTFGLPMLARLANGASKPRKPRGLVLVPTRELAAQVASALTPLAASVGLRTASVVGGLSMQRQIDELARGVDVLVATPGRLADHLAQGTVVLDEVSVTALDEADQMADMGFLPQVVKILDRTPKKGQRLLFSATLDGQVDKLVRRYLDNPATCSTAPAAASVSTMEHHMLFVDQEQKKLVVTEIAAREGRTILFVHTKHGADRLTKRLRAVGVSAAAIHGGKAQNNRTRTLEAFKSGDVAVLVATNVAARGVHIDGVDLVVHVDPPADPKDYLHRAGRTARAGESGVVITLVTPAERRDAEAMARAAGVVVKGVPVRAGDAELVRVSGARQPSGVALVAAAAPAPSTPRKPARTRSVRQAAAGWAPRHKRGSAAPVGGAQPPAARSRSGARRAPGGR
ncbi:DEAD/DEAH box helicase domain protein [Segniliparus rotundus DSM 44985]|uniref:DEAD/DEAH box helicase domain protein n=1 Tax=Segniliparus rotundus (strain ATCC BAA-972 / CDC 1076 / CIP 108378 / DSM 44985 / JCM 13578) TaxID=640132 RepID=D6ZAX6_SEGRD|nr:DEAD/DEAH box helicase [Segniliparus rotundus]ADG98862.1 DEAD/DEAH box helicase domain protein [Segniliparus rotundus DSM 44985]